MTISAFYIIFVQIYSFCPIFIFKLLFALRVNCSKLRVSGWSPSCILCEIFNIDLVILLCMIVFLELNFVFISL